MHGGRSEGSRVAAFQPSGSAVKLTALGRLVACATVLTLVLGFSQAVSATTKRNGLVGYPSFLPKSTLNQHTDTQVVGTAGRPALTVEGDPVRVVTPSWSVVARVTGPEVPGEGLPYQTPATTCTWTITLSDATGRVPVSASAFDSIDSRGNLYRPYLVPGQPRPPKVLVPGRTVSFELRAGETVGEGLMRWAPIAHKIVAKWDFDVEND
jgi:hypothetical protein